ncbi:MAG: pilus assembly protein PilP [Nitrospirae bacterium]|nr:pilus assembly protein PilP [Nitrospirota bacterium]
MNRKRMNPKRLKNSLRHSPKRSNILLIISVFLIIALVGCKGESKKPAVQGAKGSAPQSKTVEKSAGSLDKSAVKEGDKAAASAPMKEEVKKEGKKEEQKDKVGEKEVKKETEYFYDPTGKRDPFRSAILGETLRGKETLPPLQRREISELKLIGIVWDKSGYSAMLETPDGKGYTIKVGTLVGPKKGVVKKITKRTVVIEEKYMDIIGEMKTREIPMELPSKEEVLE